MTEKQKWKFTEYLVQLIEKSIDPDSTVEHNAFLPDLTSTNGTTRQCDIIIRKGTPPRETITLVEVQDRIEKVELNQFQGWVSKMKDVGAQHLICVSRAGFPDSIKEKAKQSGNTIRLVTITKTDANKIPINLFGLQINYADSKFTIQSVYDIKIRSNHATPGFTSVDKIFRLNQIENLVSIDDLIKEYVMEKELKKDCQETVSFPQKPDKLFILLKDKFVRCSFKCRFSLKYTIYQNKDVQIYGYEQYKNDTLAWILEGELKIGDKNVVVKIPTIQLEDGSFSIRYIGIEYSLPFYSGQISFR